MRLSPVMWHSLPRTTFGAAWGRGSMLANVAVLTSGTAVGQLLAIAATPALTRLYTPEDVGKLGLYTAFLGVAATVAALRYDVAIVMAPNVREAAHLTLIALVCLIPTSALFALGLYVLHRAALLGFDALPSATCWLMAVALTTTGAATALRYWFVRHEAFSVVSGVLLRQSGARSLSQVALGLAGIGWPGLVLGDVVGRAVGLGRMIRLCWRQIAHEVLPLDGRALLSVLRTYRQFPIYNLPSSVIDTLAVSLIVPVISQIHGTESAGQVALVYAVQALPVALVGGSVADVFHARAARDARTNPRQVERLFLSTAGALLLAGAVPAGALVLLGPSLFGWVFGAHWTAAGQLAAVMAPWALASLAVSPVSRVIVVFQAQKLKFMYDGLALLGVVGSLVAGGLLRLTLLDSVALLSAIQVSGYALYFLLLLHVVRRARRA